MGNKTCGECRYFNDDFNLCLHWRYEDITNVSGVCNYFAPLTNGDRIRQMSNEELQEYRTQPLCFSCIWGDRIADVNAGRCKAPKKADCFNGHLAWLNAPAESEGKDGEI